MKIFWTKASYSKHLHEQILLSRQAFMQGTADRATKQALHYYICKRPLSWWREAIDTAEKDSNKYIALAELVAEIDRENENGRH